MAYRRKFLAMCDSSRLAAYRDDDLVPDSVSRVLLGGVSRMSFWRWQNGSIDGFPPPIVINKKNYRKAGDLRQFLQRLQRY